MLMLPSGNHLHRHDIEAEDLLVEVRGLRNVADFSGNYVSIAAGVTVAGGGSVASLRNQNGVVIDGVTTAQGVRLTLAPGGVNIKLSGQPSS